MSDTIKAMLAAIEADVPVLVIGPPGTGKTSKIQELAREAEAHCEILIGSTLDPSDIARPILRDDGEVHLSAAPWARRIARALAAGKQAWLFLDELSCAPPAVQAALLRPVNERVVGDTSIKGCRIIAAANPSDLAAGGWDLAAATANRWLHLTWPNDVDEWRSGELMGWGQKRTRGHEAAAALVCGFIETRPGTLLVVPEDPDAQGKAWPSPRSWSRYAAALGVIAGDDVYASARSTVGRMLASGLVGIAASNELGAYLADLKIPKPRDLLSGKAELPARSDLAYAAIDGAISMALTTDDADRGKVWDLIAKTRPDTRMSLMRFYVRCAERVGITASAIAKLGSGPAVTGEGMREMRKASRQTSANYVNNNG